MKTFSQWLMGIVSLFALIIHTLFWGIFLFLAILLRFLLLYKLGHKYAQPLVIAVASIWIRGILWWMIHVHKTQFIYDHDLDFSMDQWNLIVANHQSWADIFALLHITLGRLPILKFFIKRQLKWLPVVGAAWWALEYPFMSRYSKEYLRKHPEKAGKDLETTRQACERFSYEPTTIVNFLKGTRFSAEKYARQQPQYKHLLNPKAGGIAFAIQALGEKFSTVIDITIHYDNGARSTWDFACGRIDKIHMDLQKLHVPKRFMTMDYTNNPDDKKAFQTWVTELWQSKDKKLEQLDTSNSSFGDRMQTSPKISS